jgi:Transcriptional accessory protein
MFFRSSFTKNAENKSIIIFQENLKKLLLISPVKEKVLSIDPGFRHGCKIAAIDRNGKSSPM